MIKCNWIYILQTLGEIIFDIGNFIQREILDILQLHSSENAQGTSLQRYVVKVFFSQSLNTIVKARQMKDELFYVNFYQQ